MTETLIPTMGLRFNFRKMPKMSPEDDTRYARVLQQRFERPDGGEVWKDVPLVCVPENQP